jgi:hypothetical protein
MCLIRAKLDTKENVVAHHNSRIYGLLVSGVQHN